MSYLKDTALARHVQQQTPSPIPGFAARLLADAPRELDPQAVGRQAAEEMERFARALRSIASRAQVQDVDGESGMAKRRFRVTVIESERGWGQKVDEQREFDTYEEAAAFRDSINKQNTAPTAPDIYWQADDPVEIPNG